MNQNDLTKQQVISSSQVLTFGEILKGFIERMSVGFVTMKVTLLLWDCLLIRYNDDQLLIAFALILNLHK